MAYAVAYFLPIILRSYLGVSVAISQILSTPPYVFAALLMIFQGWLGDKLHMRGPIVAYNSIQAIVGLCLLAWARSPGVQLFGVFLVTGGCQSNLPAILAWQANNVRGQWKRSFISASTISSGGIGGVVGSLVFRSQDAPRYLPGLYACIT